MRALSQELAARAQQAAESEALLRSLAEARDLQRETNRTRQALHAGRVQELTRLVEQVGTMGATGGVFGDSAA